MVPHVARWIVGPDQRWILAYTLVLSPVLLLVSDIWGGWCSARRNAGRHHHRLRWCARPDLAHPTPESEHPVSRPTKRRPSTQRARGRLRPGPSLSAASAAALTSRRRPHPGCHRRPGRRRRWRSPSSPLAWVSSALRCRTSSRRCWAIQRCRAHGGGGVEVAPGAPGPVVGGGHGDQRGDLPVADPQCAGKPGRHRLQHRRLHGCAGGHPADGRRLLCGCLPVPWWAGW